jgi:hypothetical protein
MGWSHGGLPRAGARGIGTSVVPPDSGRSRLVRQIVEALRPELVICGHYHQDSGKVITDSGRTEFAGVPTRTCLALGPDLASRIDSVTGGLELY